MQRLDEGIPIGSRRHKWGITADQFLEEIEAGRASGSQRSVTVACDQALGLATISVELTAPRPDRPILQLCYQLAPIEDNPIPAPAVFSRLLTATFGDPRTSSEYALPESGEPSDSVRYYASWDAGDFSLGLSLYGAPRRTGHGLAPGCLWLSWSPTRAAQPHLDEWRDRARELTMEEPTDIAGYRFGVPQLPVFGNAGRQGADEAAMREANYALYHPELLPTPPSVSALVGDHGAVFWRCGGSRWCASTAWDTMASPAGAPVEVSWNDIAPAKGGGFSEIAIGRWSVRDYHGSRPVREAVDRLRQIAGVSVRHATGYDC